MNEQEARGKILEACRGNKFKTKGRWGMRDKVYPGGWRTEEIVKCAVLDLERDKPHPKHYGFTIPIILASGETWLEVYNQLEQSGEFT